VAGYTGGLQALDGGITMNDGEMMNNGVLGLVLLIGVVLTNADAGFGQIQSGGTSIQNSPGASGGMEVLPGGFRRFRDNSGTTGILQRTPDSGFPNSQFIAPIAPALPRSSPTRDMTPPSALSPSGTLQQNVPLVPGTQIPRSTFILPGPNR
jgi:hypothetical protein